MTDELNDILEDNGISRDDVTSARLISVTYQVTDPDPGGTDWTISGMITIQYRDQGPTPIIDYDSVLLSTITSAPGYADLNDDGVAILHQAIDEFLTVADPDTLPGITFVAQQSTVTPTPTDDEEDPPGRMDFRWHACLRMYITLEEEFDWPDPWPGD